MYCYAIVVSYDCENVSSEVVMEEGAFLRQAFAGVKF